MNKTIRTLSAAALAGGLAISLASAASAQQGPPPAANGPGAERHADREQMRARFEERRQHRQQVLHDALGLRADQEGAWQAFIASERRPDGERGRGMRRGEGGDRAELTTPQRLDRMQQRMAERQQRFAQRADSIKRFYAALDGRQQKTFDALVMARGGGMGGFGHGGGRGGWGRGDHKGPPGGPGGPPPAGERG